VVAVAAAIATATAAQNLNHLGENQEINKNFLNK
jgi:hypothetical protein